MKAPESPQLRLRLVAIAPAGLLGLLAWSHRWVADDGFIDLHIADNLLRGLGPSFNVGERVESYTSPLWVLLLSMGGLITKPLVWITTGAEARPPFEWIAVALGIACAMAALVIAALAAQRLQRAPSREDGVQVPFGTLVVLAVIPFWDYATSGLETSLVFLWLAIVFWACVRRVEGVSVAGERWTAFVIGLGVLVRPDLGIFSVAFGAFALVLTVGWRRRVALLAVMLGLPLAYQLFRMGYFACLVPNTALAKEAGLAYWKHGWIYLEEFEVTYQLWVPVALLTAVEALLYAQFRAAGERPRAQLVAVTWCAAMAYGLYITRVGGDFLHGRMLLPVVFALLLPVATVPVPRFQWVGAAMLTWAMLCFSFAQIPLDKDGPGIERGRLNFILLSKNRHPVTLEDYSEMGWVQDLDKLFGAIANERTRDPRLERAKFYSNTANGPPRWGTLQSWIQAEVVAYRGAVGLFAYKAGPRAFVCDYHGLADPFASRLELSSVDGKGEWHSGRGKPGHEKRIRTDWCLARTAETIEGRAPGSNTVLAREALACGDLAELRAAVDAPMSWGRFWRNVAVAPRLTRVRIPQNMNEARDKFCPGPRPLPAPLKLRPLRAPDPTPASLPESAPETPPESPPESPAESPAESLESAPQSP